MLHCGPLQVSLRFLLSLFIRLSLMRNICLLADTATQQIPVYEFQFGTDLKEHVMRRRHDDWINATHILKAAGFDKPARTNIILKLQSDI